MYAYAHAHQIEREVSAAKKREGQSPVCGSVGQWLFLRMSGNKKLVREAGSLGVKGTRPLPFVSSSLFSP